MRPRWQQCPKHCNYKLTNKSLSTFPKAYRFLNGALAAGTGGWPCSISHRPKAITIQQMRFPCHTLPKQYVSLS